MPTPGSFAFVPVVSRNSVGVGEAILGGSGLLGRSSRSGASFGGGGGGASALSAFSGLVVRLGESVDSVEALDEPLAGH